jgi:hypothetical protein
MTRNEIITSGIYNLYKERKQYLFSKIEDIENPDNYKDIIDQVDLRECIKIYKSERQRKNRTKERIIKWNFYINRINEGRKYKIVFGTLTFKDKELKLNKKTRRRYVQNFLRENTISYIANIDYGKINNREHYHFIAMIKNNIECKKWKNIINIKKVATKIDDIERVKNYIMKMNNHAYKESTKRIESMIQDRNRYIDKIIDTMYKEEYRKYRLFYV